MCRSELAPKRPRRNRPLRTRRASARDPARSLSVGTPASIPCACTSRAYSPARARARPFRGQQSVLNLPELASGGPRAELVLAVRAVALRSARARRQPMDDGYGLEFALVLASASRGRRPLVAMFANCTAILAKPGSRSARCGRRPIRGCQARSRPSDGRAAATSARSSSGSPNRERGALHLAVPTRRAIRLRPSAVWIAAGSASARADRLLGLGPVPRGPTGAGTGKCSRPAADPCAGARRRDGL